MSAVHFIINPAAGAWKPHLMIHALADRLQKAGEEVHLYRTAGPGDAAVYAGTLPANTKAVITCGGDGTVSEVVDGLIGRPIPIAILPLGTENLLARDLGYRSEDLEQLWHALLRGVWREMDVGVVNGRHFMMVAGAGFDGEVVARVHAIRKGHIDKLDYFWPMWRTFWSYRFPPMRVVVDGRCLYAGRCLVFVGNIPRYAIGLQLLAKAQSNDGLLDVCVFPAGDQRELLWHSAVTALRLHPHINRAPYAQGRQVLIEPLDGPVPLEVDGDPAGLLPAEFHILPGKARLLWPAG